MKAIITVAGVGTRLRPHTHTQPKALVPIAGKAILGHIIDYLISGGIDDFIFVTGYLGGKIESYVQQEYSEIKKVFVRQEPREGIAHAIYFALDHIDDEKECLVMLGDTILQLDLQTFLESPESIIGIKKVERPELFGVAQVGDDGYVTHLVEKPKIPKSNLGLCGIYKFTHPKKLKVAIKHVVENNIKTHGENQLTDALMYMVENAEKIRTMTVDNWYDCGKKETLLAANAILLNRPEFKEGQLEIYPRTIIIPPVSIGKNCQISNSIIGPYVAIGEDTKVSYSIVQNSIIGSYSELESTVLENSIIGSDSSLKGLSQSLNIGDNTEINLSS